MGYVVFDFRLLQSYFVLNRNAALFVKGRLRVRVGRMTRLHGTASAALAGILMAFTQQVAAATATFDFNAIADGATFYSTVAPDTARAGFEGNWNRPDGIDASIGPVVGDGAGIIDKATGITVYARGTNSTGAVADAFFDSNNAGLGVCSSISCKSGVPGANTGDDNLNRDEEALVFTFDRAVRLQALTIRDANHLLPTGDFLIGDETFTITNGVVSAALLALIAPSEIFELKYVPGGPQLYIGDFTVAPVPLPAGALLLGAALAGLGVAGRRRSAAV
jgi:hypothetical protein